MLTDRLGKLVGLLTYIKHNITFTDLNIPTNINTHNTELEMVRIHTNKNITSFNLYIPPRDTKSNHITVNTYTPTGVLNITHQLTSSSDITFASSTLQTFN